MAEQQRPMRRVAELATLGAEIYREGIGYEQRHAWRGVLAMTVEHFMALVSECDRDEKLTVGQTLAQLVAHDLGPLTDFGEGVLHQRRATSYAANCASWEAQPACVKQGSWRRKQPTRGQRMLMIRMSHTLGIPLPGDVTRGEAAKWISEHGGNPNYNKGG